MWVGISREPFIGQNVSNDCSHNAHRHDLLSSASPAALSVRYWRTALVRYRSSSLLVSNSGSPKELRISGPSFFSELLSLTSVFYIISHCTPHTSMVVPTSLQHPHGIYHGTYFGNIAKHWYTYVLATSM